MWVCVCVCVCESVSGFRKSLCEYAESVCVREGGSMFVCVFLCLCVRVHARVCVCVCVCVRVSRLTAGISLICLFLLVVANVVAIRIFEWFVTFNFDKKTKSGRLFRKKPKVNRNPRNHK